MTRTRTTFGAVCLGVLAFGLAAQPAAAYPDRPIRIIVPYGPGGATDVVTRILAQHLEEELGQTVVVMNVAGGGGAVGWQQLLDSRPDGYTLSSWNDAISVMEATGAIDFTTDDFENIAVWGTMDHTVFAAVDGPFETLVDLKEAADANPDQIGMAIGYGTPSQFVGQLVLEAMDADINLVNVGGGAEKKAAVLGHHVETGIEPMPGMAEPVRGNQFRVLAVLSEERPDAFPDMMTAKEQGFDIVTFNTYALNAPKGIPEDRLEILAEAVRRVSEKPEFIEANARVSFDVNYMDREQTREHIQSVREVMLGVGERLGF